MSNSPLAKKNMKSSTKHTGLQNKIGIPGNGVIEYVNLDDILLIEGNKSYTKVVTTANVILSSYALGRFRAILDSDFFYQVHRSYILNLNHIKRYEMSGLVVMADDTQVP